MGRVPQQRVDDTENENFYKYFRTDHTLEEQSDTELDDDVNQIEKQQSTNTNNNDDFFDIFRNIVIRKLIFGFVHRPLVLFKRYEDIHSLKWILNYGSNQLLIEKVKRNEYLSDIFYLSNRLKKFKSINDLEFYKIFNNRYKRYLVDPRMIKVKEFLNTLNLNDIEATDTTKTTSKSTNKTTTTTTTTTTTPPITTSNRPIRSTRSTTTPTVTSTGKRKKTEDEEIQVDDKNKKVKLTPEIKDMDPSYINDLSVDGMVEEYKNYKKKEWPNFRRALESKHFKLGQYVLDKWLGNKWIFPYGINNKYIHIGDRDIIEYYCNLKDKGTQVTIGLQNIQRRQDFQEIMQLLEESNTIDKADTMHMDLFKNKKTFTYFLENGYSFSSKILQTMAFGNDEQFSCFPILLEQQCKFSDSCLETMFQLPSVFRREYAIYQTVFKYYSTEEVLENSPVFLKRYQRYKQKYGLIYNIPQDENTQLVDLEARIEVFAIHSDSASFKGFLKQFKSTLQDTVYVDYHEDYLSRLSETDYRNDRYVFDFSNYYQFTCIESLLLVLISERDLNRIKMVIQEFPGLVKKTCNGRRDVLSCL